MTKKLVHVINHARSVSELYLSDDFTQVTEVKCLSDNRVKEYKYDIDDFFKRREISREVKNNVAIAMAK
jgi:hypothetical protein